MKGLFCLLEVNAVTIAVAGASAVLQLHLERKATTIKTDQAEVAALTKKYGASKQHQRKILDLQYRKKILQSCIRKHKRMVQQVEEIVPAV